jgi:hypothetical protein
MDVRERIEAIQHYQQCDWESARRLWLLSQEMAAERAEPEGNVVPFNPRPRPL